MDLLLITDEVKSHYVYIKDFDRFMCNNTKTRNIFQYFSSGNVFQQNKKICLKIGVNAKLMALTTNGKILWKHGPSSQKSICCLEIYQTAQNTRDHFCKNLVFSKGNQLFAGDFHALLQEINVGVLQFTKEWKLRIDCLTSRVLLQRASSYNYQFCTKACVSSRLVSQG